MFIRLPLEIRTDIIEYLPRKDILTMTTLSRSTQPEASRALLHKIRMTEVVLTKLLESEDNRQHIRSIEFVQDIEIPVNLLQSLVAVKTITVMGNLPSISPTNDDPPLLQLLRECPTIKFLRLVDVSRSGWDVSHPGGFQLYREGLLRVSVKRTLAQSHTGWGTGWVQLHVYQPIIQASAETIVSLILCVYHGLDEDSDLPILDLHLPVLRHLHLDTVISDENQQHRQALARFLDQHTTIESLGLLLHDRHSVISELPLFDPTLLDPTTLPRLRTLKTDAVNLHALASVGSLFKLKRLEADLSGNPSDGWRNLQPHRFPDVVHLRLNFTTVGPIDPVAVLAQMCPHTETYEVACSYTDCLKLDRVIYCDVRESFLKCQRLKHLKLDFESGNYNSWGGWDNSQPSPPLLEHLKRAYPDHFNAKSENGVITKMNAHLFEQRLKNELLAQLPHLQTAKLVPRHSGYVEKYDLHEAENPYYM